MFESHLVNTLSSMNIPFDDKQIQQCIQYNALLLQWNERFNLTRIVEPQEVAIKHFADSSSVVQVHSFHGQERLIDVGSGAVFPRLVLKILFPQLHLTLLDAVRKRLRFLEVVVASLALQDVHIVHARAEQFAKKPKAREQ